jgi:hypothetical protein
MPIVDYEAPENAAVMQRFCSLGLNCEFGEAQRKCGIEPLDLLRWASTPPGFVASPACWAREHRGRPGRA